MKQIHQKRGDLACGDSYTCFLNDIFLKNHIDFKFLATCYRCFERTELHQLKENP